MNVPADEMTDQELRHEIQIHRTAIANTTLTEGVKERLRDQLDELEREVEHRASAESP